MARKPKPAKAMRRLIRKHTDYKNSGQLFTAALFTVGPPPTCTPDEEMGNMDFDEWSAWNMYAERVDHWFTHNLPAIIRPHEIQYRYWKWLSEKVEGDRRRAECSYRGDQLKASYTKNETGLSRLSSILETGLKDHMT